MKYWTKSAGAGGSVRKEEDFVVEEIPLRKFFVKFARGNSSVAPVSGPYSLAVLKKKGVSTHEALQPIRRKFRLKKDDIGYAGLKDKFAVTSQYITIRGKIEDFKTDKTELSFVGYTDKMMQVGGLEGNKFVITLHRCNAVNAEKVISELKARGMPNYFGMQRFGKYADNHIIGRLILKGGYKDALELINKRNKKILKFYIHAYQSHIFNKVLDTYISMHTEPFFGKFPIVGYNSKLSGHAGKMTRKLLSSDGLSTNDFAIRELNLRCDGSVREAFIKIKEINYNIKADALVLSFTLPKGSYATVLIREVVKDGRT